MHKVQVHLNDSVDLIDDLDKTLAMLDLKMRTFVKTLQPKSTQSGISPVPLMAFKYQVAKQQCMALYK